MADATSHCTEITFYATFDSSFRSSVSRFSRWSTYIRWVHLRNYVTICVECVQSGELICLFFPTNWEKIFFLICSILFLDFIVMYFFGSNSHVWNLSKFTCAFSTTVTYKDTSFRYRSSSFVLSSIPLNFVFGEKAKLILHLIVILLPNLTFDPIYECRDPRIDSIPISAA